MIQAAAILVPSPDEPKKFLAIKRTDNGEIGLPCGKVEAGETTLEAAKRECFEETGISCALSDVKPFIGRDRSGILVTTYLANTEIFFAESEQDPSHASEGTAIWVDQSELEQGLYGEYNKKVFEHFGYNTQVVVE